MRPELGGVERWARELCARLPALRRLQVVRPPPALSHRAGPRVGAVRAAGPHRAAPTRCCARRTSRRWPRATRSWSSTTPPPLRHPGWYSRRSTRAWQRRLLPLIARRARAVITVSRVLARASSRELLGVDAHVVYGGVDPRFTPGRRAGRAPAAPVRALRRLAHGAQEPQGARPGRAALARDGIDVVVAGGHRPQFARRSAASTACTLLGHVADDALPGLYAGAEAFVLPVALRGLRPAGARGDGLRHAGRGREHERAAGDLRRRRPPGRARAGGAARGARRSCSATRPSARGCAQLGLEHAPPRSRGSGPRARSTRCVRTRGR